MKSQLFLLYYDYLITQMKKQKEQTKELYMLVCMKQVAVNHHITGMLVTLVT